MDLVYKFPQKELKSLFGPQIGRGCFSFVHKRPGDNFVTIISRDKAKECAAIFGLNSEDLPESKILFPDISYSKLPESKKAESILEKRGFEDYKIYQIKYFPVVKSLKRGLKTNFWEFYKKLYFIWESYPYNNNNWERIDYYKKEFAKIDDEIKGKYGAAIINALETLINYGDDVWFEISPRNVRVDTNGRLVLLDVFFFRGDMQRK